MRYRSLAVILVVCALAVVLTPTAQGAVNCTNDLLSGAYGLRLTGMLQPPLKVGIAGAPLTDAIAAKLKTGAPGSNAAAGYARLTMDGAGGLSGTAAASILGIWSEGPVVGQYSVSEDCAVALTIVDSAGMTQHFEGVLTRTADSAAVLQTDAGTGLSGSMKRTFSFCDGSALPARLKMQMSGAAGGPTTLTTVGALEIAPDGTVTASEFRFSNGGVSHLVSTGNLVIQPDCTVSLTLAAAESSVAYQGLLVNGGREMMLVRSDPGVMVGGDAVGQ